MDRVELEPVDRVEITVLMDNVTDPLLVDQEAVARINWPKAPLGGLPTVAARVSPDSGVPDALIAEPGFSALGRIEKDGRKRTLLFDTGVSPGGMVDNMRRLGIAPAEVEVIVLSHGHWDHVTGMEDLVRELGRTHLPVMIHPEFWSRRRVRFPGLEPAELPSTSRSALQEMGFSIVDAREKGGSGSREARSGSAATDRRVLDDFTSNGDANSSTVPRGPPARRWASSLDRLRNRCLCSPCSGQICLCWPRQRSGGSMRAFRPFLCVILGVLVVAGPAQAGAAKGGDDRDCHTVDARGVGNDPGDGTTTAKITRDPLLKGTTASLIAITGGAPPVLTFAATVVFTTKRGTLTVAIAGTFNVATGAFDASGPVTSGTGRFAGATGNLSFAGVEDLTTGRFTETVRGTICLADDDDDDD